MKKLIQALRELAGKLYATLDTQLPLADRDINHAAFGLEVLAHIVSGMSIKKAFGAPGDWGYGTPIGDGLLAMLRDPNLSDHCIEWHFLPELPDAGTTVLIAVDEPDSDEVLIGYQDVDGSWWQNPSGVDLFIEKPVYAWAEAPAKPRKPAKEGGAS